jgi:Cu(I)/Ag(I) efflux system membrane fusion protein
MCKDRIEKASISVKGVKYASWDIPSGQLRLVYNGLKTNLEKIEKQIAASGHDTEHHKAIVEIYTQLPACCQYVRKGQEPKPGQMTKH